MDQTIAIESAHAPATNDPHTNVLTGRRAGMFLLALTLINVHNVFDRQLPSILGEAIKRDLALSDLQLGTLTGFAFALCYSLLGFPLGRLSDRRSPRAVMLGCLGIWSVMTGVGGYAQTFLQLALSRVGVAIGEAGSTPASHALISRALPLGRRGVAIGVVTLGVPVGMTLGYGLGGWLADVTTWQNVMIGTAAAGLLLAVPLMLAIPKPQRSAVPKESAATMRSIITLLFREPAFRWLFIALSLCGGALIGFMAFAAPFLIRVDGFTFAQAGLGLGLLQGIAGTIASVAGGRAFDRQRGALAGGALRWSALAFLVAAPLTIAAWLVPNGVMAVVLLLPFVVATTFVVPIVFGTGHLLAGAGNQAVTSSLLLFGMGLLGGSLGPFMVGITSDLLKPQLGPGGLRVALCILGALCLLCAAALAIAARKMSSARPIAQSGV